MIKERGTFSLLLAISKQLVSLLIGCEVCFYLFCLFAFVVGIIPRSKGAEMSKIYKE